MRYIYSLLFYLALPFVFLRLFWRSRRQPAYRRRLNERLGFYSTKLEKSLWVHCVSLGETIAAIPLIKALMVHYPNLPIVITTMTPTGAARVKSAFGNTVTHAYIPYDLPTFMWRFMRAFNPSACIIMETELWPNLLAACSRKQIPIFLVNARLSERSARRYQRVASLARDMLQRLTMIAAQGQADAERFVALGAPRERVMVTGNIKFDMDLPAGFAEKISEARSVFGGERFIWIAASTHEGEEEIILEAHQKLREKNPHALLILVPRHPDRFNVIADLCARGFEVKRRSLQEACSPNTGVYLGDTMGELLLLYGVANVAFVGGSLIPRGGHNMLEPGILGKPILTGSHLFNFTEISELFVSAQALRKVNDASTLAEALITLMENSAECARMSAAALNVVAANRGALTKQMKMIARSLDGSAAYIQEP